MTRMTRAVMAIMGTIGSSLTDADWQRTGTHTEDGPYGVEQWLRNCSAHAHDHAEQMR